jgi:hypothetical protein
MSGPDPALQLLNALVVDESGTRWGERATDVQRRDAEALLDVNGVRRHWIGRSRGYSKTDDLACVTVAAMLVQLRAGDEAVCVAADRDQAAIVIRRIRWIAERTPELHGSLQVGAYDVRSSSGVRLEAMASDAAGSWGRTPSWVVCDELGQWPRSAGARELWDSVSTATVKARGRLAIISTAGSPDHWSRGIYEHAVKDETWRVSEVHEPAPWLDQTEVEAERRRLPESTFARLFLNRWASSEDTLLAFEDVVACAWLPGSLDPEPHVSYIVGVDLAVRRDRAVVAVCHSESIAEGEDGVRIVCDHLDVFEASRERDIDLQLVEGCVEARARSYNHAPAIFDPAMAHQMMARLRHVGLKVIEHTFSATSNSKRALVLLELVRGHRLALPDEPDVVEEFTALRLVERGPGLYRYDHDPGRHDDVVTAVGLAAHHLVERPAMSAGFIDQTTAPSRWNLGSTNEATRSSGRVDRTLDYGHMGARQLSPPPDDDDSGGFQFTRRQPSKWRQ